MSRQDTQQLEPEHQRRTTATTSSPARPFPIRRRSKATPRTCRRRISGLDSLRVLRKDAKVELMRGVPLFSGCSKRELAQIASVADEISFNEGRTLIQGDGVGREFIVVLDGSVEVRKGGRKLPTRGGTSFFGELALLTDAPRSATVTSDDARPARS